MSQPVSKSNKTLFIKHIVDERSAAKKSAYKNQLEDIAHRIYSSIIPPSLEKDMRKMPTYCFKYVDAFTLHFNNYLDLVHLKFKQRVPVPAYVHGNADLFHGRYLTAQHYRNHAVEAEKAGHAGAVEQFDSAMDDLMKIVEAFADIDDECSRFQDHAETLLKKVRTLASLKKVWPECYDEFLKVTGLTEQSPKPPALRMDLLNGVLGEYLALKTVQAA